ncbi:MAG: FAD-dependent oxidoreductase [Elusimicrobiota bacterium]|jgi:NAD(P)H-nitrite reductase large subunit|nr:FAD-dependent oxidoreductase [Elusimicrobiota bacterium]
MKYLIIGNSAAGVNAAQTIRSKDKEGKITILSNESIEAYGRPLISYFLSGKIAKENIFYRNKNFYKKEKIDLFLDTYAQKIDIKSKKVMTDDLREFDYDKLLIATGSIPFIPETKNLKNQKNVFTFLTYDQSKKIKETIKSDSKVVIAGGGLIGLKAAEGLYGKVADITVIDLADRVMASVLDKSAADMIQNHIAQKGINFILKTSISEVRGQDLVEKVVLSNGKELDCDILIIAVGVRPNTALAKEAGLTVNRGIVVNEFMQTSDKDIYAAGDCVESLDLLSKENKVLALMPNAVNQGETAGFNMAGYEKKTPPSFAMNAISFFGMQLISAGITGGNEANIFTDKDGDKLRRLNIANDDLIGFVLINDIQRAGIYTSLINDRVRLSDLEYDIKSSDIGLSVYKKPTRQDKIWGRQQ